MASYHVNPASGDVSPCRARKRCPFGTPEEHFTEQAKARRYYELLNEPKFVLKLNHEQLSALRRSADFREKPGDEDLMARLEVEEDNRYYGGGERQKFSVLELERIAEIAEEKREHFDLDGRLSRHDRGVATRLYTVWDHALIAAEEGRAALRAVG